VQLCNPIRRNHDNTSLEERLYELAKRYGQRYVENVQEVFDVVAEAWQDCGDRLEGTINTVTDEAQRAKSSKRAT
jgi:hypothetical protein